MPATRPAKRFSAGALPATTAACAAAALLACSFTAPLPLMRTVAWTLLVAAAYAGWGFFANCLLLRRQRADWTLRSCWGMVVLLGIGGVLVLNSVANRQVLTGLVVVGLVGLPVGLWLERTAVDAWTKRFLQRLSVDWATCGALVVVLFLSAILLAGSAVHNSVWYVSDDGPAYFAFVRDILDTGSADQPFSTRRIQSYAGQSFLQAMVVANSPIEHIHVFDRGLCALLLVALFAGDRQVRRIRPLLLLALPLLLVLVLPNWRGNSASTMSGALLFFALYRTCRWIADTSIDRAIGASIAGAMVGALCTLRPNYLVPGFAFLGLNFGFRFWRDASHFPKPRSIAGFWSIGAPYLWALPASLLILSPWAISSYQLFETPLFPLIPGTARIADLGLGDDFSWLTRFQLIWKNITNPQPIHGVLFFLVATLLFRDKNRLFITHSFIASLVLGFFSLLFVYMKGAPYDNARYYFAFEVAGALAIFAAILSQASDQTYNLTVSRIPWPLFCVVLGTLICFEGSLGSTTRMYGDLSRATYENLMPKPPVAVLRQATIQNLKNMAYSHAQQVVPPNARLVTMVDHPYRLDFRRNHIQILDFPGFVSPSPGIPAYAKNADKVADYFLRRSIRYLMFIESFASEDIYRQPTWVIHSRSNHPGLKVMAPLFLDAFSWVEELRQSRRVLYAHDGLVVLDLGQLRSER